MTAPEIDQHLAAFALAHPHLSADDLASVKALAHAIAAARAKQGGFCRNFARDPYDEDND
ncbi:hypothetical protein GCM10027189_23550 [Rufibacter soli]